jgi:hypothetical protein
VSWALSAEWWAAAFAAPLSAVEWWAEGSAVPLSAVEWWVEVSAVPLSAVEWRVEVSAVPLSAVGSSGHAALRSDQDLHHASIGSRSPGSIDLRWRHVSIGLRSPGSIGLAVAASPSRQCRSSLASVSMAARAGAGNPHRGAGSESGPAATIMATTRRS